MPEARQLSPCKQQLDALEAAASGLQATRVLDGPFEGWVTAGLPSLMPWISTDQGEIEGDEVTYTHFHTHDGEFVALTDVVKYNKIKKRAKAMHGLQRWYMTTITEVVSLQ